jgi:hypothetical protein
MATHQQSVIPMVRPMDIQEVALPPDLQEKLKAPMPPGAVSQHPTKKYLSSIKPAFVIERMNDVFGIGGYREVYREISVSSREVEYKEKDDDGKPTGKIRKALVFSGTVHATLMIPKYGIHLENFGGSENEDAGDALKGACTDAFTKMCSHLGVGLEIYKGKADGAKGDDLPPCPACKKSGAIIKGKAEYGGGYVCFTKKQGCGAKFSDAEMEQIKAGKVEAPKPPQSTAKPNGAPKPIPADGSKFTISAKVTEKRVQDRKKEGLDTILWLQVGQYKCASKQSEIWVALRDVKVGSTVTLLVSKFNGQDGPIHQIHKVIPNAPEGGRQ